MDFELKNFEDKINDITEQFMSLLDSDVAIEEKMTNKFDNATFSFDDKIGSLPIGGEVEHNPINGHDGFKFDANGIQNLEVGGMAFDDPGPGPIITFGSADDMDLNKRLEDLYQEKKSDDFSQADGNAHIAFSDSNLVAFNSYYDVKDHTKDEANSANEKEGYNMANYGFTESDDNSVFSFATVPQERALTAKRSFSDILFMDIPWDTKIDFWGGFKSFLNTNIKITF